MYFMISHIGKPHLLISPLILIYFMISRIGKSHLLISPLISSGKSLDSEKFTVPGPQGFRLHREGVAVAQWMAEFSE
jgi:hypothetical protein